MLNTNEMLLGQISGCIAGDHRYTETILVGLNTEDNNVSVRLYETGAVGGMDGPGGSYEPHVTEYAQTGADAGAKQVVALVKGMLRSSASTIRVYGKPSKRFMWYTPCRNTVALGLSVKSCELALRRAKETNSSAAETD